MKKISVLAGLVVLIMGLNCTAVMAAEASSLIDLWSVDVIASDESVSELMTDAVASEDELTVYSEEYYASLSEAELDEVEDDIWTYVTFEELNADNVFLKQSGKGKCTLASAAMIMRRAAMLAGDEDWASITESSLGSVAWVRGVGLAWDFSYRGITMTRTTVSSIEDLKALLAEHPEGVVAYDRYTPHAIALTDYDEEEDVFYCSDPSNSCASGRYPVSGAMISLKNVSVVWYVVKSDTADDAEETDADITEAEDTEDAEVDNTESELDIEETETELLETEFVVHAIED